MHFIDTVKNALLSLGKGGGQPAGRTMVNVLERALPSKSAKNTSIPELFYPRGLKIGIHETELGNGFVRVDSYYEDQLTGFALIEIVVDKAGVSTTSIRDHSPLTTTSWELLSYIQQR